MPEYVNLQEPERFDDEVLKSSLPVLAYFYSDDCHPCQTFSPLFERMAADMAGQMKFVKILRPHNRGLSEKYAVKSSPTLVFFRDGKEVCPRLVGYINYPELKEAMERVLEKSCSPSERPKVFCDVLIVGAGPSGLTAAIYTARSRLETVVIDRSMPGGQVATTFHVANYPGTNGVIRGIDLMENMKKQAADFGARIDDLQQIKEIRLDGDVKLVKTDKNEYHAKSVIIATGAEPRKLPVEGEREFRGRGIHYCATCDGALYQDTNVLVIGGGISAVEEADFLSRYARTVTIVNRSDHFKAAESSVEKTLKIPSVSVIWNSVIKEVKGEGFLQSAVLQDVKTGSEKEIPIDGIFVYIGMQPNTGDFADHVKLSDKGYILTDGNMTTDIPGVFAAGDVREKEIRQISTAVGDGTVAGIMAERYISLKFSKLNAAG